MLISYAGVEKYSKLFTVLNNTDNIFTHFRELGLSSDEAKVYVELLKSPGTPAEISQSTGINRTRIYRLAGLLEKRSLITKQSAEKGTVLVAADPATLQVNLVSREERVRKQRQTFAELLPDLENIRSGSLPGFAVNSYEGVEGFKQMLWHELKTDGEFICFGDGEMEKLVPDRHWTEKQRALTIDAGYLIREILNPDGKPEVFTDHSEFEFRYRKRYIAEAMLKIRQQTVIYNDTVAVYNWRHETKVGTEILSQEYAAMMRQLFEICWSLSTEPRHER